MRLESDVYRADIAVHLTLCAHDGSPFDDADLARDVCSSIERTCGDLRFELYAYCLMPDHLHVLLNPASSGHAVAEFLQKMKSFTTALYRQRTGRARLWQYSARDRLVRPGETLRSLARYIADNPVRRSLVAAWTDWPFSKVLVEIE